MCNFSRVTSGVTWTYLIYILTRVFLACKKLSLTRWDERASLKIREDELLNMLVDFQKGAPRLAPMGD